MKVCPYSTIERRRGGPEAQDAALDYPHRANATSTPGTPGVERGWAGPRPDRCFVNPSEFWWEALISRLFGKLCGAGRCCQRGWDSASRRGVPGILQGSQPPRVRALNSHVLVIRHKAVTLDHLLFLGRRKLFRLEDPHGWKTAAATPRTNRPTRQKKLNATRAAYATLVPILPGCTGTNRFQPH